MGIEAKFNPNKVSARLLNVLRVIEKRQIERLQYLGEMCVTNAKDNRGYTDQTGNLNSSIGYAIYRDGQEIMSVYDQVLGGAEGSKEGKALAEKVAREYQEGILLVVTAGMNYALKVESKGRNVLTSAELLAEKELPKMLDKLVDNINKAFK